MEDPGQAVAAALLLRIRVNQYFLLPAYLAWHINQPYSKAFLRSRAKGTAVKMIIKNALESLEVNVPDRITVGDILFPRRGDLGRIGVAKPEYEGWLCGSGCLRARLKDEVDFNYIHQYVQLDSVKKWLESNAHGFQG
jgi:phosphatidylserine/phosphatidylglycerophosphate/cardiolipin synthase-like enzyme